MSNVGGAPAPDSGMRLEADVGVAVGADVDVAVGVTVTLATQKFIPVTSDCSLVRSTVKLC